MDFWATQRMDKKKIFEKILRNNLERPEGFLKFAIRDRNFNTNLLSDANFLRY